MRHLLICLALLAPTPTLADDLAGSSFAFGLWRGGAAPDSTGVYSHCYASLSYTQGEQLWVNVTRDEKMEVVFAFPGVTFKPGQEIDASLMMESGSPTVGKAFALDEKHIVFSMAPIADTHVFLSQGRWLRIMGVGHDEAFEATGLGGVLGLVRQCHEANKA